MRNRCAWSIWLPVVLVSGCGDDVSLDPDVDLTTSTTSTTTGVTTATTSTTADPSTTGDTDPGTTTSPGTTTEAPTTGGSTGDTSGTTGGSSSGGDTTGGEAVVGSVSVDVDVRGALLFPPEGIWVAFHDESGSLLHVEVSDDTVELPYRASWDAFPEGGMITVGWYEDFARVATLTEAATDRTYAATFHLDPQAVLVDPSLVGGLMFNPIPPAAISGSVASYVTDIACGGPLNHGAGDPPHTHSVFDYCTLDCSGDICTVPSNLDMLVWALDGSDNVLGYAASPGHPLTPVESTPNVVDLNSWTVGPAPFSTQFSDAPGNLYVDAHVEMWRTSTSLPFRSLFSIPDGFPLGPGDNIGFQWPVAPTFADYYRYDAYLAGLDIGDILIAGRRPSGTFAASHSPTTFEVESAGLTYDDVERNFAVDLSATVAPAADAFVSTIVWQSSETEWGGSWNIVSPAMPTTLVTPELPTSAQVPNIDDFVPETASSPSLSFAYEVWQVQSSDDVPYDALADVWGRSEFPTPAYAAVSTHSQDFAIVSYHSGTVERPGLVRFETQNFGAE